MLCRLCWCRAFLTGFVLKVLSTTLFALGWLACWKGMDEPTPARPRKAAQGRSTAGGPTVPPYAVPVSTGTQQPPQPDDSDRLQSQSNPTWSHTVSSAGGGIPMVARSGSATGSHDGGVEVVTMSRGGSSAL